jgi:hypothetical protein
VLAGLRGGLCFGGEDRTDGLGESFRLTTINPRVCRVYKDRKFLRFHQG